MGILRLSYGWILIPVCLQSCWGVRGDENSKLILISPFGEKVEVSGTECNAGVHFQIRKQFKCACVTGIWAFYSAWCSAPRLLIGGSNYCVSVSDFKINQVSLLSSPNALMIPSVARLSTNMEVLRDVITADDNKVYWNPKRSSLVTFGAPEWELMDRNGESRCLQHSPNANASYCHFSNIGQHKITRVRTGCGPHVSINIQPDTCAPFLPGNATDENACHGSGPAFGPVMDSRESLPQKNVIRRQSGAGAREAPLIDWNLGVQAGVPGADDGPLFDWNHFSPSNNLNATDDGSSVNLKINQLPRVSSEGVGGYPVFIDLPIGNSPPEQARMRRPAETADFGNDMEGTAATPHVKSNPVLLEHLSGHVESEIRALLGNPDSPKSVEVWPVVRILEMSMSVLKRTCNVLPGNFLDLALRTFLDLQIQSLHIKEPFVIPGTFSRIQKALTHCYKNATSHNFILPMSNGKGNVSEFGRVQDHCTQQENRVSDIIEKDGKTSRLSMPINRRANDFEPIVEIAWKVFVNAHSYCFNHFSDYYNDHHSYTVSLLPFFTNEIQEIWNPPEHNGQFLAPDPGNFLYGGLLGDHHDLLRKIDMCVAASRVGSAYPFHMNRPPRDHTNRWKWRRRKRSMLNSFPGHNCLKSTQDVINLLKLPKCYAI